MTVTACADCRVCGSTPEPLFRSASDYALTSSAAVVQARTNLDSCPTCGHVQTQPIPDLHAYYSDAYQFRAGSAEEDDLCATAGGTMFRSDLQASIVERLMGLRPGSRVLDYGSGKARTLRLLAEHCPGIQAHAFDVSDSYRRYWDEFIPREAQASFNLPSAWSASFDAVLSFFALEHVERPAEFVSELRSLLRPGGRALVVLPNMYANVSDFVVVDHINHFSPASLGRLFAEGGFSSVRIDDTAQTGWFVVDGLRGETPTMKPLPETRFDRNAREIADFWLTLTERVRSVEAQHAGERVAIYGSGVYGLYLAGALLDPSRIAAFLDRNKFRQGLEFFGAPVVAPESVPIDATVIYVGLNPLVAQNAIAAVPALASPTRAFFYV